VFADHLGTPRQVINTAKQLRWRWDNTEPFGANAANQNPANLGVFAYNLRFPGQYFDSETGLHYNMFRDYDPKNGRYLESDPIGLDGGLNTYGYAGENPLSFVDLLGLDREIIIWSPLPHITSIFGHVSSRGGNGENDSFGPGGWDKTYPTTNEYIDRQTINNNRTGIGLVVELTPKQDAKYDKCMRNIKASNKNYNEVLNNCGTSAQTCLMDAGTPLIPSIFPSSFQQQLLDTGLVNKINIYSNHK
jgi:RHS repeat-associated protein